MSIDTEMLWGPATPHEASALAGKGKEDREAITALLGALEEHQIGATWAVVGHLFLDHCTKAECLTSKNASVYSYSPPWYRDPYSDIAREPMRYGKDVVEMLLSDGPLQEIGYHSYSHPVFTDIPREMAEGEIAQAKEIEQRWGIRLRSFVFPQDKVAHVDLLAKHDFLIYRGAAARRRRPDMPPLKRKLNGAMDKVLSRPVRPQFKEGVWEIPSSMPFSDPRTPSTALFRAKVGLRRTLSAGGVFHVFMHPWNLLLSDRTRADLDALLGLVSERRDAGELEVMTMGDYAARLSDPTSSTANAIGQ